MSVYLHTLLEVGAFELVGEAGDGRAVRLVLLVEAVVVAVAHPRRRDAVPGAGARELQHPPSLPSLTIKP